MSVNINHPNVLSIMTTWSVLFLVLSVAAALFANYMYISHMENKIVYPGEKQLTEIQLSQINIMRGGVSLNGIILAFLCSNIMMLIIDELISFMY